MNALASLVRMEEPAKMTSTDISVNVLLDIKEYYVKQVRFFGNRQNLICIEI